MVSFGDPETPKWGKFDEYVTVRTGEVDTHGEQVEETRYRYKHTAKTVDIKADGVPDTVKYMLIKRTYLPKWALVRIIRGRARIVFVGDNLLTAKHIAEKIISLALAVFSVRHSGCFDDIPHDSEVLV